MLLLLKTTYFADPYKFTYNCLNINTIKTNTNLRLTQR